MPQSKRQKTDSYQPVVALSFIASCVVVQFLIVCSFTLAPSVCTKSNRNGAYNSVVLIAGFGILAHKPGSTDRCVSCGSKSRFTIYQGTLVGMND